MTDKNIKVVISDLDGTLLNASHQIGSYTKDVIKALEENGYAFWIATGRHHCDALGIREKLGAQALLITANGATVSNYEGELVHQETIDRAKVEGILSLEIGPDVYQNLYQGSLWLMEQEDQVFKNYYEPGDFMYTLCRFSDYMDKPINKIFFTSLDHDQLVPIAKAITEQYGEGVDVTFSMPECLEVMPKGANKGAAILRTLETYGYSKDQVVAFGDGLNDLEMLSVIENSFIMENANPELKRRLPDKEVIGSNAQESVAKWLETNLGLKIKRSA